MSATEDLLAEIQALSLAEQRRLLAALTESVRRQEGGRVPVPVGEIRGIAKPDGEPPTDKEVTEGYTQYVMEKYS